MIREAGSPNEVAAARALFLEYGQSLGFSLCFQDFDAELAGLPGAYAPSRGRLLLAAEEGQPAGCVAVRPLAPRVCEMKRLYVRPAFRARGLGRGLAERIIEEARAIGYDRMLLDTVPQMQVAQKLYEQLGFRDVPMYTENPVPGARCMALRLR